MLAIPVGQTFVLALFSVAKPFVRRPRAMAARDSSFRGALHLVRHFEVSTDIAAPPERVWEVMREVERWAEWTPSIERITRVGGAAFAEGSRVVIKQPRFPPAEWTVTSLVPGRGFDWVSVGPGLRATGRHAIEGVDGGSRVTLSLDFEGVLGGMLGALTKGITERYIALEAQGLKGRSEDPTYRRAAGGR